MVNYKMHVVSKGKNGYIYKMISKDTIFKDTFTNKEIELNEIELNDRKCAVMERRAWLPLTRRMSQSVAECHRILVAAFCNSLLQDVSILRRVLQNFGAIFQ